MREMSQQRVKHPARLASTLDVRTTAVKPLRWDNEAGTPAGAGGMKNTLSIASVLALVACGGSGGGGGGTGGSQGVTPKPTPTLSASAFDTFASFETAQAAFAAEKQAQNHTAFTDGVVFPSSDTATFSGIYQSVLDRSGTSTTLIGLADLTADFAANTVNGSADRFVGELSTGATGFYTGTVALDGEIGKDPAIDGSRPNDLRLDYSGILTGNGQTVSLSGSSDMGKFLQTPITGLEATGASTAFINGAPVTDDMSLYMDRN
jgi:hypothetical protein